MRSNKVFAVVVAAVGGLAAVGTWAIADAPDEGKLVATGQLELKLPPGWTAEDMQACMAAGTPGKMQEHLAQQAGVWNGKTTMWMTPDSEPAMSECISTITPVMGGRYVKGEIKGDIPGMGPFEGFGIYGYDNVTKTFVSTWIDSQMTGIMNGTGELSADGKVMTWKYTFNSPLTKKPAVIREIGTVTGPNTKRFEMFGTEPKSGKEFKMMSVEFTKQS